MSGQHYRAKAGHGFCCTMCNKEFGRSDHARLHVRGVHFKGSLSLQECDSYIARPKEVAKGLCAKCGLPDSIYRLKRNHVCPPEGTSLAPSLLSGKGSFCPVPKHGIQVLYLMTLKNNCFVLFLFQLQCFQFCLWWSY